MKTLATLITVAMLTATASATPIPPKARKLAEHGREMHKRGEYEKAITAFKEAYVIAPSPGLLFNLAQAYRLQGNCEDASIMYNRYLATNPDANARAIAEEHLSTVDRCMQKRSLNIPFDDSVEYLNVPAPPGPERIIVADKRAIERPAGIKKDVGMGLAITGGVALLTAAYFGYRSYEASQDVEDAYARGAKWKDIQPIQERGEKAATAAKILGVGGGLAIAGGATLWLLGRRDERANQLAITPTAKGGANVSYQWQF